MRFLRALLVTLKNLFRPTFTVEFPRNVRARPTRYRVGFALLRDEHGEELCIGCLACERICPSGIITVKAGPKRESPVTKKKRGYADDVTIDTEACLTCELCVQVCPTDALVMTRAPERPAEHREELFLTMARLYENAAARDLGWANGSRLMGMQEPPEGDKKKKKEAP
jgi:formate hydrogenlyase subunit 6/NADH:ubiquinone oxidoreductase subunit I